MQNKIIRYLLNASPRTHIGCDQFKIVGMLPVEYRVVQMKLNHMFNIITNTAPNYLKTGVTMVRNFHSINTRSSVMSCVVPRVKGFGKCSFLYTAILEWNALPLRVQQCTTLVSFKINAKKYLWTKVRSES